MLIISVNNDAVVAGLLTDAKHLAEREEYDAAIQKLRECLDIMNAAKDFKAAADLHLLILDYEKLKLESQGSSDEKSIKPEKGTKPVLPRDEPLDAMKKPAKKDENAREEKATPRRIHPKPVTIETVMDDWKVGKVALDMQEYFKARQKFMIVKRNLIKLGISDDRLQEIDEDIQKVKVATGNGNGTASFSNITQAPAQPDHPTVKGTKSPSFKRTKPISSASSSGSTISSSRKERAIPDSDKVFSLMKKAQEAKTNGDYQSALESLNRASSIATDLQRKSIRKQIKRIGQLASMKQKMSGHDAMNISQFNRIDEQENSVSSAVASPSSGFDIIDRDNLDHDTREKLQKRQEAEKLIVEAENTENVSEAIEKFQDAAHLLLVTGTRRDRVEWVYEKINQLKRTGIVKKVGLFDMQEFRPSELREYAFNQIDEAKQKDAYGKYKEAVELYKKAIKALLRAGWTNDQVNYIIQDMVKIQKKQDLVEKEDQRLQEIYNEVVKSCLLGVKVPKDKNLIDFAAPTPIDEDVYRPGREKTVMEKEMEKLREEQNERRTLQQTMFSYLDEARHKITLGEFQEAISLYKNAIELMDALGGWENQKNTIKKEIDNLYVLIGRQKELAEASQEIHGSGQVDADLAEKNLLIKKAALLNQENLKEKLLKKRLNDEKVSSVFDILIPMANNLKEKGRYEDALIEFKEALKMLEEAGWKAQTQGLKDEIAELQILLNKKEEKIVAKGEKRRLMEEIFDKIIPEARKARMSSQFSKARTLYQQAIQKLREIGWANYISPIQNEISEIDEEMSKGEMEEESSKPDSIEEIIDLGMKFLAKDLKEYALMQLKKAVKMLESTGRDQMRNEIQKQVKKLELEIRLEDSKRILLGKRGRQS